MFVRQLWLQRRQNGRTAPDTIAFDSGFIMPPVDVFAICKALGVKPFRLHVHAKYKSDGYLVIQDGQASLYTSACLSTKQRRFVVAHLLGHLLLHTPLKRREERNLRKVPRYLDHLGHRNRESREHAEASDYAMKLLVPSFMMHSIQHDASMDELAQLFQVPQSAMNYRIKQLYGLAG